MYRTNLQFVSFPEKDFESYLKFIANDELEWLDSSGDSPERIYRLTNALKQNTSLVKLTIENSTISPDGGKQIGEMLCVNSSILQLQLLRNKINSICVKHIAESLKSNTVLNILNMSYNEIGDSGSLYLAEALKVNCTLLQLVLNGNGISDIGVKALAEALKENESLVVLDLMQNSITEIGAFHIADMLKFNNTLFQLDLDHNDIGEIGATKLANALKTNCSLGTLLLGNIGNKQGPEHFADMLKVNRTLTSLYIHVRHSITRRFINSRLDENENRKRTLFLDTLKSNRKTKWNRAKVMVVGEGGVGKTATVRSLEGMGYNPRWDSTIAASISEVKTSSSNKDIGWKSVNSKLNADYSSRFAARIMVEGNSTRSIPDTLSKPTYPNEIDNRHIPTSEVELQRKQSLHDEATSSEKVNFNAEGNAHNALISGKRFDENLILHAKREASAYILSVWDFAGQSVFYPMHHVFLTSTAAYLLVFDTRAVLGDPSDRVEALKYVAFWLKSVQLHAPSAPIFLVGTYSDTIKCRGGISEINNALKELAKASFSQIVLNEGQKLVFFPIDNKGGSGIGRLRLGIEEAIRCEKYIPSQEVSIKWMAFLDMIVSKRNKGASYLSLLEVKELANLVGIYSVAEQEKALNVFYQRGMLIHFTATETLKNTVIIDPQWLVDALGKVIREKSIHKFEQQEFERVGLDEDLSRVFTTAVASRDFLEYVWKTEQVDFLIDLMQRTLLLSKWSFNSTSMEELYLIPSLLSDESKVNKEAQQSSRAQCRFNFSRTFLPSGVFERLICLCVDYTVRVSNSAGRSSIISPPKLCRHFGSFELSPGNLLNLYEDVDAQSISLHVENPRNAARTFSIIQAMLNKLNHDAMNFGLKWDIEFEVSQHSGKFLSYKTAEARQLQPWFEAKPGDRAHNALSLESPVSDTSLDSFIANIVAS